MTRLFYRPTPASYDVFNALARDFFSNAGVSTEMRVRVKEAANEYTLVAELPGVTKDDINVEINGADVRITAENKVEENADEWSKRTYARSFTLPLEIDDAKAAALYENGVLKLTLPKKAANASKRLLVA
jgi:HSP20 family protein